MKTKVKRLSKRTLAVFLGVVMLITSLFIGSTISANSATYYMWYGTDASRNPSSATKLTMTDDGSVYTASFTAGSQNYFVNISSSSTMDNTIMSGVSATSTTTNWCNIENSCGYQWATSWASKWVRLFML